MGRAGGQGVQEHETSVADASYLGREVDRPHGTVVVDPGAVAPMHVLAALVFVATVIIVHLSRQSCCKMPMHKRDWNGCHTWALISLFF